MNKIQAIMGIACLVSNLSLPAQVITKLTSATVNNTVCPIEGIQYEVSSPGDLGSCEVQWSAVNGQYNVDINDQRKVTVNWSDITGAKGKLTATFVNCEDSDDNDTSVSKEELILSVKGKTWGSYTNSVNIDYCTTTGNVNLGVPEMIVPGTGGIGQPPRTEVTYEWTLPPGWKNASTGETGTTFTSVRFLTITPTACAVQGQVSVKGIINNHCSSADPSATAVITLNGVSPVVTIGPEPGYTGAAPCKTDPVTFTASMNVSLGCVNNYTWTFPSGWKWLNPSTSQYESSPVSTTSNIIDITPGGSADDEGDIKVTANFICGNTITSAAYRPEYEHPYITGPDLLCSSGGQFELNNINLAVGMNVTWSVRSHSVTPASGTGAIANLAGTSTGSATITFTVTGNCEPLTYFKFFSVGNPQFSGNNLISGSTSINCSSTYTYDFNGSISGNATYEWEVSDHFNINGGNTGASILVDPTNGGENAFVSIKATNACGSTYFCKTIDIPTGYPCGPTLFSPPGYHPCVPPSKDYFSMSVYPNPTSEILTIEIEGAEETFEATNIKESSVPGGLTISLYNFNQQVVYQSRMDKNIHKIETKGLEKGIYILHLRNREKEVFMKTVVIK